MRVKKSHRLRLLGEYDIYTPYQKVTQNLLNNNILSICIYIYLYQKTFCKT